MLSKPKFSPLPCPTLAELERGLKNWAAALPDRLRVEAAGYTPEGHSIWLCEISDFSVSDENKQIALFTTCHAATEKNGVTSVLRLMKFLLSDEPLAVEIRHKQRVMLMPCNDPAGYEKDGRVRDVYYAPWEWAGVTDREQFPEAAVLQDVIDTLLPDVLVGVHGFSGAEQLMWESTGISWTGGFARSFDPHVPWLMDQAADDAGFFLTKGEVSNGTLLATAPVPGANEHFYLRCGKVLPMAYAYHNAHTIGMTMEVGFEESAVVRLKRLLELGHDIYRGERLPGYPVNQVGCRGSMAISAYGATAEQRRASRVELWRRAGQLFFGVAHPEERGRMAAFFGSNPAEVLPILGDRRLEAVLNNLRDHSGYNWPVLTGFFGNIRSVRVGGLDPLAPTATADPLQHGVNLRLLLPYPDAKLTHLALNGTNLKPNDYFVYHNPGTIVEIPIAPEEHPPPLQIVTCRYETRTCRRSGFTSADWALNS